MDEYENGSASWLTQSILRVYKPRWGRRQNVVDTVEFVRLRLLFGVEMGQAECGKAEWEKTGKACFATPSLSLPVFKKKQHFKEGGEGIIYPRLVLGSVREVW